MMRPFARTGGFVARSLFDSRTGDAAGLPVARPTVALAAQVLRDEIVLAGLKVRRPVSEAGTFQWIRDEVVAALDFYGSQGWLDDPRGFFAEPPSPADLEVRDVKGQQHSHQRIFFESGYQPRPSEPGRERWLRYDANRRAYGLLLRHPEPRPWVVCVHGTEMGRAALDLRVFRARSLHEDLGLNVIMPVLPMHGPRGRGLPKNAVFPGENVMDNVHATAQSVWDIRRVLSWIRTQEPQSPIALNGMSLGGYIAALVASIEPGLTCAILGVPVADLIPLLGHHSGLSRDDPRRATMTLAEPISQMVSPLSLSPQVPMSGRFIYAGVADRVVHPREQVVRLWEHWGKPEIVWYEGGHAGFVRSQPVQRFVVEALRQAGMLDSGTAARR